MRYGLDALYALIIIGALVLVAGFAEARKLNKRLSGKSNVVPFRTTHRR